MSKVADPIEAGREALARHAWQEAFDHLSAADAAGKLTGDELALLGDAAWWAGRFADAVAARERSFAAFSAEGQRLKAAGAAIKVAGDHYRSNATSVAKGWYARAEKLLAEEPDSAEHGYLVRDQAFQALSRGDVDLALERATLALDIGTKVGDRNVQALALQMQGQALVAKGRVEEGLALQDEATVAAVSGELDPLTTGVVYCNVIASCSNMADYRRAGEWTEAAKRWCERQSINGFPGVCRVHRAEIMRLRGAWADAEQEAEQACTELAGFGWVYLAADAFYELGEIRLRMGELSLAEEAFRQANEMGREPMPGMALLRLAEGKTAAALSAINRAVAEAPDDPLFRAKLLPSQVRIALAAQQPEGARKAAEEMEGIAATYGTPALEAMAATARGALQAADGETTEATRSLRRGLELWRQVDLPYEAAEARVLLGLAYRTGGDEEGAASELAAARATFERLGAPLDARRVSGLLATGGEALGVRVTRTFMFTDIERSTNLVEAMGDEAWQSVLRWHDGALRALFAEHEGVEVDHTGDGFFVAFEDAGSALACAVAIQRALTAHRKEQGFAPQVRIGVHAAEAAEAEGSYRGKGVHQAARVAALATGGQILASRAALDAAGPGVAAGEPRLVELKGIAEPVEVAPVEWR